MIKSAENTINIKKIEKDKRKFNEFIENNEENENDKIINTLLYVENNDYLTKEFQFDIYVNKINNNNDLYITREIEFDI
ncbi:unnamed protein product [Rhizophagus irregularis]|uniref:Uncharacterized protein n=1 Tax=Rhizophagus irregularis TaxID=588596 RepID=A0A2I1HWF5_9GLOM|nr:hypothetical protein RhiirA4_491472 [Rhizophagus irregularis]CAB4421762.1 unnamed protein product [Rhizophagus irregularis]